MIYLIRERIFTLADRFVIEDNYGNSRYEVVGKIFSMGNKLRLYDMEGRELIYIEQQIFRLLSEYYIYRDNELLGRIKKEFTLFKPRFNIESPFGNFTLEGDILHHNFEILKNGTSIAWISKRWVALSDTYSVDIADGEDHSFILSMVIVLDQIFYDGKRK